MGLVYFNNIEDVSVTTGTGPITVLGTPPVGKEAFNSRLTIGQQFYYRIKAGAEVENGIGTYSATNQITRTRVTSSSNADALVNFSAGEKEVLLTSDAEFYRLSNPFPQITYTDADSPVVLDPDTQYLLDFTDHGAAGNITIGFSSHTPGAHYYIEVIGTADGGLTVTDAVNWHDVSNGEIQSPPVSSLLYGEQPGHKYEFIVASAGLVDFAYSNRHPNMVAGNYSHTHPGTQGTYGGYTLSGSEYAHVGAADSWYTGSTVPTQADPAGAVDGDFYLRSNGDVYVRGIDAGDPTTWGNPIANISATYEPKLTGATSDSSPLDTDEIITLRSGTKRSTWTVIKAFFKTYFDGLYSAVGHGHSDKADLVNGTVPASQLPSYVDDVLEYANFAALPGTGEAGKIYVTLDTNITYRWSGSAYVEISASLALGETSATAYRGDRGATAYAHSQAAHNYEPLLTGATADATPLDADTVYGGDSSASFATIKTTWTNIKAFFKTYNDTLYAALGGNAGQAFVASTLNALTLTAQAIGFTVAGGTSSKTLTVDETVALSAKANLTANTFTGEQTLGNNSLKTIKTATFNGEISTGATTGTINIDWTAGLFYVQSEPTGNITYTFTNPAGPCRCQIRILSDGTSAAFTITLPTHKVYGSAFAGTTANKAAILSFYYDGADWHFMGASEV